MIIIVTGANTGIGFGIVQRILESHSVSGTCPTIIMACRNQIKAQEAKNILLDQFFPIEGKSPYRRDVGERKLVLLAVDLGSPESVLKACKEVTDSYDHIDLLILNAGIMLVEKIDIMMAIKNLLTRPSYVAKTGGDAIVQRKGLINKYGLGECFAANVFGHWIMVGELRHLIERAIDGKVIWFSSTTANPMFFDHNDFQGIKSDHPYESSKRLCELLSFHLSTSSRVKSFVCSPGNVVSNITQGNVNVWIMLLALYIMRLFFCSGINITPENGATSALFLHDSLARDLDPLKLYHSDITPFGKTWVKLITVNYEEIQDVVDKMDDMVLKFKASYKSL